MDDTKYLAVGRIFLEETRAAMPMPQDVAKVRPWHAALMRKCDERSRAEQGVGFREWQEASPSERANMAYAKLAEDLLGQDRPS